jgi:hypothetical protein
MALDRFLPRDILDAYEVHNFKHAAEVLSTGFEAELGEIIQALRDFKISTQDILRSGGNESEIPKRVAGLLRPQGWLETRISGDLLVRTTAKLERGVATNEMLVENYLDGHKIDFVKNGVAFDLEWNSKDQTFDRDLYAFRAFHEAGVVGAAVLVTRSEELNQVFRRLNVLGKYGASTTWMGKLLYRLKAGRNGGCPVLIFGITKRQIEDWSE